MNLLSSVPSLLCLIYPVAAQVEHGTIGVVYFTKEKISVAADSRALYTQIDGRKLPPDDTVCKIAALGGNVIFVSTGTMQVRDIPGVPDWNNIGMAQLAYGKVRSLHSTARGHIREIADEWSRSVSQNFRTLALLHLDLPKQMAPNGILTDALFGGLDAGGNLVLFVAEIVASPGPLSGIEGRVWQGDCASHHNFCADGSPEIAFEFADQTSERAKVEAAQWEPGKWKPTKGFSSDDRDMLWTMRMVELTIQYHKGGDVGGPVDAVQLNRDGSVRWYARKQNCQEN
jgi:hypothetical protein